MHVLFSFTFHASLTFNNSSSNTKHPCKSKKDENEHPSKCNTQENTFHRIDTLMDIPAKNPAKAQMAG